MPLPEHNETSSPAREQFYIGKIVGYLLALLIFAVLTGIGIKLIPQNPRVGWFATLLFGMMCVFAVVEIFRHCGLDQDEVTDVHSQLSVRRLLVPVGSILVTVFLGIADNFISIFVTGPFPRSAVWFGTFVTTLAFYPLREKKERDLNFKLWVVYCALMGAASVVISFLKDRLETLLT